MKEVAFEASFSFQYCDRPGVRAERMDFKVPEEVKAERLARLQTLQAELTRRALARTVGTEVQVLLEGVSKKQNLPGRDAPGQISLRGRDAHGRVVNLCWPAPTDWQTLLRTGDGHATGTGRTDGENRPRRDCSGKETLTFWESDR